MKERLEGWKGKLLSQRAKLILLKSVLQPIPLYYVALIHPPQGVIDITKKKKTNVRLPLTSYEWAS